MIYYIIFWALFTLALIEIVPFKTLLRHRSKKILFILALIFLIIFAGFRDQIGVDYFGYLNHFNGIRFGTLNIINKSLEPTFSLLFRLIPSFKLSLVTIALCSVGFHGKAFYDYNCKFAFTALFFYYATEFLFYDMGIIRQGLAVGVCLLSLPYLKNKDKRFFLFVLLAGTIHISALTFSLLFFMGNKEYSRKIYYGFSLAFYALYYTGMTLIHYLRPFMFGSSLLSSKMAKFSIYDESNISLSILRRLLFLVLFVELYKSDGLVKMRRRGIGKRENADSIWIYINSFFLSTVLLSIFGMFFSSVAGRGTEYFYILYIFIYVDILAHKNKFLTNSVLFIIFAILAYITFEGTLLNHGLFYLPYKSIL